MKQLLIRTIYLSTIVDDLARIFDNLAIILNDFARNLQQVFIHNCKIFLANKFSKNCKPFFACVMGFKSLVTLAVKSCTNDTSCTSGQSEYT